MTQAIAQHLQETLDRIHQAEHQAQRSEDAVRLLAVSKTFPESAIEAAYAAGQRAFGENYVQELERKAQALKDLNIEWHFIGPLQSNKSKIVAEHAHWMHTVDRLKIAERLSNQRPANLAPLQICIQVNVSSEDSKSGCQPEDALALARAVRQLPHLTLRGLMCIPEATDDHHKLQQQFEILVKLQQAWREQGIETDTLSMGMSQDLEQAVLAGSTMVRVGTAIFGHRDYGHQA